MIRRRRRRCSLCFGVAVAVLAGCGAVPLGLSKGPDGTQPAVGTHQSYSTKRTALLYVIYGLDVVVLSYPQGRLVQTLTGFSEPTGICSDRDGNVFVTDFYLQETIEYAHGGSSPTATIEDAGYHPDSCAVDALSNTLAVGNYSSSSRGPGNVALYSDERGNPKYYSDSAIASYVSCAYDGSGNLYVVGAGSGFAFLDRKGRFENVRLNTPAPVATFWDGQHITVLALPEPNHSAIFRLKVANGQGIVKRETLLSDGGRDVVLRDYWIRGKTLLGSFLTFVGFWNYPKGGNAEKVIRQFADGLTISY